MAEKFAPRQPRERLTEQHLIKRVKEAGGVSKKWGVNSEPDRLNVLPGAHIFFVECKKPKGRGPTVRQAARHAELRALGFRVYVCHTKGDVDEVVGKEVALYGC